jgi:hypothetical protein
VIEFVPSTQDARYSGKDNFDGGRSVQRRRRGTGVREKSGRGVRGDVAHIDRVSRPDLTVTHGDSWINGGKPLSVDDKKSFLKRVDSKLYSVRDLDSVEVEMHGDIAITHGRLIAQARTGSPDRRIDLPGGIPA